MSLFGKILEKLGLRSAVAHAAPPPIPAAPPPLEAAPPPIPAAPMAPPPPVAIAVVDVVAQLEDAAAANPQKLNWKVSIVDLLKLLDLDSSLDGAQGARGRARLPVRQDGRLGADEHVVAQEGAAEARGQRRQHSDRICWTDRARASRRRRAGFANPREPSPCRHPCRRRRLAWDRLPRRMAALGTRALGTQGLRVSELGLGCVGISELYGPRELDESRAMLRRALELGVDFFDTSDVYGAGHNEQFLGEVLGAERRGHRAGHQVRRRPRGLRLPRERPPGVRARGLRRQPRGASAPT